MFKIEGSLIAPGSTAHQKRLATGRQPGPITTQAPTIEGVHNIQILIRDWLEEFLRKYPAKISNNNITPYNLNNSSFQWEI